MDLGIIYEEHKYYDKIYIAVKQNNSNSNIVQVEIVLVLNNYVR